jgi:PD-(D/E)XK nuclease superfamily
MCSVDVGGPLKAWMETVYGAFASRAPVMRGAPQSPGVHLNRWGLRGLIPAWFGAVESGAGGALVLESEDQVPGRPEMTEFRRALRGRQARWREARGYPIGSQPIAPKRGQKARPVGNRLAFDFAKESGVSFVTAGALEAARGRAGVPEPHQRFDHQRLWAELLWSPALAFNLFGELAADRSLADRAIRAWWPDAPGSVAEVFCLGGCRRSPRGRGQNNRLRCERRLDRSARCMWRSSAATSVTTTPPALSSAWRLWAIASSSSR